MQLKLKRSQRSGGIMGSKVIFALDARTELTRDETELVRKYALGKLSVYDSQTRKKHIEAMDEHLAASKAGSNAQSIWSSTKGLARVAMAALSLHVTIDSLTKGQHIECKDLDELLGAEGAIWEACQNLKGYLETAATFDGREEVVEF